MKNKKLDKTEEEIRKVMNSIAQKSWFSEDIEEDNFQLKAVLDYFRNIKGKKILDVGCGRGRFTKQLVKRGGVLTGVDLSDVLIKDAKKNVPKAAFVQASATELPFADETFDFVLSIETFEHIPDTKKAVAELCRVLKKNGKIIIIDKNYYSLHPNFMIPTPIRKFVLEKQGKWVYQDSFTFKEKYFVKKDLDQYLALHCRKNDTIFLPGFRAGPKMAKLALKYPTLVSFKINLTNTFYRLFPFTSLLIAWRWKK